MFWLGKWANRAFLLMCRHGWELLQSLGSSDAAAGVAPFRALIAIYLIPGMMIHTIPCMMSDFCRKWRFRHLRRRALVREISELGPLFSKSHQPYRERYPAPKSVFSVWRLTVCQHSPLPSNYVSGAIHPFIRRKGYSSFGSHLSEEMTGFEALSNV